MHTLIENYRNLPAGHCGSGAMRNLIFHYCGLDLEEGVVFGLGAGLDSVYFDYELATPPYQLFGRGSSMEVDLAETLGIDYAERMQPDDDLAWEEVREEVLAGRPTMLSGDILYLDYREYKVHFPAHRFVLLGFDEGKGEAYIADRLRPDTEICSMQGLRTSRNPPDAISTHNAWGKFSSGAQRHSLPDACGLALYKTVTRMQGMDTSQRELMSPWRSSEERVLEVGLKGLRTLAGQMKHWPQGESARNHLIYLDNAIMNFGTGGGFFRNHFAVFMAWAQEQRPDLVTSVTVDLARQAAAEWNALSPTLQTLIAAPTGDDIWAQVREQVLDIYETEYSLFGHLGDRLLRG